MKSFPHIDYLNLTLVSNRLNVFYFVWGCTCGHFMYTEITCNNIESTIHSLMYNLRFINDNECWKDLLLNRLLFYCTHLIGKKLKQCDFVWQENDINLCIFNWIIDKKFSIKCHDSLQIKLCAHAFVLLCCSAYLFFIDLMLPNSI